MLAPGVPLVLEEFHTDNNQDATFVVSSFVLGFAFGPLIVAPLSELYGRVKIYHVSNVLFTIFTVAGALSTSINMLIAFRFFAGCAGVTVITCGSGTIVDLMPAEQRGRAMSLWSIGPLLGPFIGPVCAGFLVESKGWRWVFWTIAMAVSFYPMRVRKLAFSDLNTGYHVYNHIFLRVSGDVRPRTAGKKSRPAP